jgi:hypothetical protein
MSVVGVEENRTNRSRGAVMMKNKPLVFENEKFLKKFETLTKNESSTKKIPRSIIRRKFTKTSESLSHRYSEIIIKKMIEFNMKERRLPISRKK